MIYDNSESEIKDVVSANKVIDYVLESEAEDFAENPSDNHVFYHALVAGFGLTYAQEELKETLEKLK